MSNTELKGAHISNSRDSVHDKDLVFNTEKMNDTLSSCSCCWFWHSFEPRYNDRALSRFEGKDGSPYIGEVCTSCGKFIPANNLLE